MQPILIDRRKFVAQATIKIVKDPFLTLHRGKLPNAWLLRRSRTISCNPSTTKESPGSVELLQHAPVGSMPQGCDCSLDGC